MGYIVFIVVLLIVLIALLAVLMIKGLGFSGKAKQVDSEIEMYRAKESGGATEQNRDTLLALSKSRRRYTVKYQRCWVVVAIVAVIVAAIIAAVITAGILAGLDGKRESDDLDEKTATIQEMIEMLSAMAGGVQGYYEPGVISKESGSMADKERIIEQFRTDSFYDLYLSAPKDIKSKMEHYKYNVYIMVANPEKRLETPETEINLLEGEAKDTYNYNISMLSEIELSKVPAGHELWEVQAGLVSPLSIGLEECRKEFELRWQCYCISPTVSMLMQTAKAALNTEIALAKEEGREMEMLNYAGYAISLYLCLMRYDDTYESNADCCYWIAKAYYIVFENLPEEYYDLRQHCMLMAYAFSAIGLDYLATADEVNDHNGDLEGLYELINLQLLK